MALRFIERNLKAQKQEEKQKTPIMCVHIFKWAGLGREAERADFWMLAPTNIKLPYRLSIRILS